MNLKVNKQELFILTDQADPFKQFEFEDLAVSENTIYGVDRDCRIVLINPAYFKFAEENGGSDIARRFNLGSNLLSAIGETFRDFYIQLFAQARSATNQLHHEYECSSPKKFRKYRMTLYPLRQDNLLIEHCLLIEEEHEHKVPEYPFTEYVDPQGVLHMCGHCRRIRHNKLKRWDWFSRALDYKEISHGLCDTCVGFYYPD